MSAAQSEIVIFDSKLKAERDYWKERLSREIGPPSLPPDLGRPANLSPQRKAVETALSGELHAKLMKLTGDAPFLIIRPCWRRSRYVCTSIRAVRRLRSGAPR